MVVGWLEAVKGRFGIFLERLLCLRQVGEWAFHDGKLDLGRDYCGLKFRFIVRTLKMKSA